MSDIFLAGGSAVSGSTVLVTSSDAVTWTAVTGTPLDGGSVNGLAWNGTLWVAAGKDSSSNGVLMSSTDGTTWTNVFQVNGNFGFTAVCWTGSQWVAAAFTTPLIYTSPDGVTWTAQTTPFDGGGGLLFGVASNGSLIVAGGFSSDGIHVIMTSPDGVTWTAQTTPFDGGGPDPVSGVATGDGIWTAWGTDSTGTEVLITSPDGMTWTHITTPLDGGDDTFGNSAFWNGHLWVGGGKTSSSGGPTLITSPDGVTWTARSLPWDSLPPCQFTSAVYSVPLGLWVAVNATSVTSLATSPDGITWTGQSSPLDSEVGYATVAFSGLSVITAPTVDYGWGQGYAFPAATSGGSPGLNIQAASAFAAGYAQPASVGIFVNSGLGQGFARPARAGTYVNSAFGAGFAQPAIVTTPAPTPVPPTGINTYLARTRTFRAVPTVTPPLAPPPPPGPPSPGAPTTVGINLGPFGIPRVSETFVRPTVINGIPYAGPVTIGAVTNTNPAVVTTNDPSGGHGLLTGDTVTITQVGGSTGVNGTWVVTKLSDNTFSIPTSAGGAYTSGGVVTPWLRTPYRIATVTREVWAKQLQIVVGGQDVTFFRNTPVEVMSWGSQEPGGDASAVLGFPQVGSFDQLPIPPALAVGTVAGLAGTFTGNGYWQASAAGVVSSYGDASFFGDALGLLNQPVTGIASHPTDYGYALVAADGGVFCFGAIAFRGSLPSINVVPDAPIVGIAVTSTGHGYWLVGADGAVYAFGDAGYHGNAPVGYPTNRAVGIARSPTGDGYLIAASNGGVFALGAVNYHGNGIPTFVAPYTGIATRQGTDGYWLVNTLGEVYAFGGASYHGGTVGPLNQPVNSIWITPDGAGYWLSASDGGVFAFGDARFFGSQPSAGLPASGSLSWLRLGAPVTINWVDPAGGIHPLFEGAVADFDDQSAPGLQAQILGVVFQCDWYLAKPIINLPFVGYDPDTGQPIFGWDIGAAIAQAINSVADPTPGTAIGVGPQPAARPTPFTGNRCRPVTTGILTVQRGAWDKLLSSYITAILAQASTIGGAQWTVGLARPRTPIIKQIDTANHDWTVWTGGHGIDTSGLSIDQSTAADAIYATGTSPTKYSTVGVTTTGASGTWSNAKYPRPPIPAPAFPLSHRRSFAPGDGQPGFAPFSDWMRTCGYPLSSADTYMATNVPADIVDQTLVEQYQQMAGLTVSGLVDKSTWDSAFTTGTTAGAVSSVYYQPVAELAQVEPYTYNPSGDRVGTNPFYNPRIPRVERYEQMGQNVSKGQGILSAALELGRTQNPIWQGTLILTGDPREGSRFQIAAGDNILLKDFHGRDILFHISQMEADFTPQQMSVRLTVSSVATQLMTLAAIIARDTAAHGVQRAGRPNLVSLNVSSSVATFDSESSAGLVPDTVLTPGGWTVIRVPFSEFGQIAKLSLQTVPAHPFAVGVFSGPVTPASLFSAFGGNSPLDTVPSGANPWNFYAPALDALGLLYGAGGPNAPCGYWPSDPNGVQTLTGEYVDGSTWTYAPAPGFVPWLWVGFYTLSPCTISGRFLVAPQ